MSGHPSYTEDLTRPARRRSGDKDGTRVLIDVLLQHRRLSTESIVTALEAANQAQITDAALIAVEARRHTDTREPADVTPIGTLSRYDRPAPTVVVYDQLLTGETG